MLPVKRPQLGLWMLTALVAGNMIGSGIFLLPSSLAAFGSIGLVAWIFTAIGAIFLALVFAQLSRMIPKTGGPYAYCREGFGEFAGFIIAYNYWIAVWVGNAAIALAFIGYLSIFWPGLSDNNNLTCVVSIAVIWLITFINILGIRQAGILQLITTILKILPLIAIAAIGLFFMHPHYLNQFNVTKSSNFSALTATASLTLWSFIGLESATVPADAATDPKNNISKATIMGTILVAVIYIFSTVAVMGLIPISLLAHSTAPYADAANLIFGHWAYWIVGAGAVISTFGALNGWTLLAGQLPYAAARDGLFPKAFSLQSKGGAPIYGLILSSILVSLVLLLTLNKTLIQQFTFIILLATFSSLVPYFFTTMAELILLYKNKGQFSPKRLLGSATIAIIAGIYSYWTIIGAGKDIIYYGTLLLFSGVPVYVWVKWRDFSREEAEKLVDAALYAGKN